MRKLLLACLLALGASAQAQEPTRMLLEAGIVGGNSTACPGHYMGVEGLITFGVSAYGMVENYRCTELDVEPSRSVADARARPVAGTPRVAFPVGSTSNTGTQGDVSPTVGASLTFRYRYGARFIVEHWTVPGGAALVLLQVGTYFAF